MKLRTARADEAEWINARYAEVRFLPSDLAHEVVVIAEIDGEPAGLGRLVDIDEVSCELGGMLVFDRFRGRGVARAIIDELLRHARGRAVYCIPFADLEPLYAAAGFTPAAASPTAVSEKFAWCQRTYDRPVVLLTIGSRPDVPL